jgi:16S rRNA (guanine527-N7)-methyltransferase
MPDGGLSRRVRNRLEELGGRYDLGPQSLHSLAALLQLLADAPHAPTTVRSPHEAVDAHVADSLVALELGAFDSPRVVLDIGAGAGFPSLALAAARPDLTVHAAESSARKCEYIRAAALAAGLRGIAVYHARAEELPLGRETADIVTVRALASLPVLAEYAAPLLAPGGTLIAWKGRRDEAEEADGTAAAALVGLAPAEIHRVEPFADAHDRHLHVFRKVAPAPERFPRRPGMARKRPLSANSG